MNLLHPPRSRIMWNSLGIGSRFKEYRGYTRPNRVPAELWTLRFVIGVPDGYDRATVEEQHTFFDDYESGWWSENGEWDGGHDWRVVLVDINGAVSPVELNTGSFANVVPDAQVPWITCNQAPWLNCALEIYDDTTSSLDQGIQVVQYAGRDKSVTQSRREKPGRVLTGKADFFDTTGPDSLRYPRAISNSGRQVALLRPLGDRLVGTFDASSLTDIHTARQGVAFSMYETEPQVAEINIPCQIPMNGTDEWFQINADGGGTSVLIPSNVPFAVFLCSGFSDVADAHFYARRSLGSDDAVVLWRNAAGSLQFDIEGQSGSGTVTNVSPVWFDGDAHVCAITSDGSTVKMYRDGELVETELLTYGVCSPVDDWTIGADDEGASGWAPFGTDTPAAGKYDGSNLGGWRSWAFYDGGPHPENGILLTDEDVAEASYYMLGYSGYRMPPAGCAAFYDTRDNRCFDGISSTLHDLVGLNILTAALHGSPKTRGIPVDLAQLENP